MKLNGFLIWKQSDTIDGSSSSSSRRIWNGSHEICAWWAVVGKQELAVVNRHTRSLVGTIANSITIECLRMWLLLYMLECLQLMMFCFCCRNAIEAVAIASGPLEMTFARQKRAPVETVAPTEVATQGYCNNCRWNSCRLGSNEAHSSKSGTPNYY